MFFAFWMGLAQNDGKDPVYWKVLLASEPVAPCRPWNLEEGHQDTCLVMDIPRVRYLQLEDCQYDTPSIGRPRIGRIVTSPGGRLLR